MPAKLLYRDIQGRDFAVDLPEIGGFLGRGAECIIRTDDLAVQRRHCQITSLGDHFIVRNLASCGSFVNEHSVKREALHHNDVIRCGSLQVRFVELAPEIEPSLPESEEILSGRYEVIRQIGQDGFLHIYQAQHLSLGRDVALQILAPPASQARRVGTRFLKSARAVAQLRSPHTMAVLDCGATEDGVYYVALETYDGPSLAEEMRQQGILAPKKALSIAMQVCHSLSEAHRLGFVHRDLSPGMIFFSTLPEEPDLIKVLYPPTLVQEPQSGTPDSNRRESTPPIGSIDYRSPEEIRGGAVSSMADLYGLAIILYEMLTGRLPVEGSSPMEAMLKKFRGEPLKMEGVPAAIVPILSRALAIDPALRQHSAEEFRVQCEEALPKV